LEEMRQKKVERWDQFVDVMDQIKKVASEIRPADFVPFKVPVDQSDLSLRKLEELTKELQSLQKEKVSFTYSNLIHFVDAYSSQCQLFFLNSSCKSINFFFLFVSVSDRVIG
jgi:F-type H+-transporting ATPase subunit beta/protein regulator of cytokinesis 1